MKNCLDEGTLQGYLDGELSPALMETAAAHISACEACATAVCEAEAELSMFSVAFAEDAALVVPTARLRERIDTRIAELPSPSSYHAATLAETGRPLRRWFAALAASFALTPARAAAFAALVIVGLIFAPLLVRQRTTGDAPAQIAANTETPATFDPATTRRDATTERQTGTRPANAGIEESTDTVGETGNTNGKAASSASPNKGGAWVLNAGLKPVRVKRQPVRAGTTAAGRINNERETDAKDLAVPGEENYLIAIASLNRVIEAGGDGAMRPALRADLERNVADLDQAITASRRRALRNPQDKDAAGFLFAAYQSKVELLRTVADQSQMAMLGR